MISLKNKSFLKLLDLTPDEISGLLELAADLKQKKKAGIPHKLCEGKNVALLFEKDSTRTRCAFEVADLPRPQRLPDEQEGKHRGHRPGARPDVRRY